MSDPCAPFYQWSAWNVDLPALENAYEEGHSNAVLKAVEKCALAGLPQPYWCRRAYLKSWRKAKGFDCRTLDEAFDFSRKGVKLAYAKRKYQLADQVTCEVGMRVAEGQTVSDALIEVEKRYPIDWQTVRDWYYERRARFCFLTNPEMPAKD